MDRAPFASSFHGTGPCCAVVCLRGWVAVLPWIYRGLFTCSIVTSVGLFPVGGNWAQGPRRSRWKRARACQPARCPACTHGSHPPAACALDSPPLCECRLRLFILSLCRGSRCVWVCISLMTNEVEHFVFLAFCINFILKFLFFQLYWLVCHFLIDLGQVLCVYLYPISILCVLQIRPFILWPLFSLKGIFL